MSGIDSIKTYAPTWQYLPEGYRHEFQEEKTAE
jgi:hypothetical protein